MDEYPFRQRIDGADGTNLRNVQDSTVAYELSAFVKSLLDRLGDLTFELKASSKAKDVDAHYRQTVDACRLSRRIRLKLGNLWKITDPIRDQVTTVFEECAKNIDVELPFDDIRRSHVQHAKNNIEVRVSH